MSPKLVHVGVVVRSIDEALEQHRQMWGVLRVEGPYYDPEQGVNVAFLYPEGSTCIELIEPADESSPVDNFLKRGGGLAHLCFEVPDLDAQLEQARAGGAVIASPPKPAVAFEGRRVAFVRTSGRQLIEYVECAAVQETEMTPLRFVPAETGDAMAICA